MDMCPAHAHPMPFDRQYMLDPYPTYRDMHAEGAVRRICLPDGMPVWYVTGYQEVQDGLRNPHLVRAPEMAGPHYRQQLILERLPAGNLLIEDPPAHSRLRRFINVAFHPKRVADLEPLVEQWVADILDSVAPDEVVDIMALLAVPLPINAVCRIMGVPESDRETFLGWGRALFMADDQGAERAFGELLGYLSGLVAAKRAEPDDDLMSRWVRMSDEDGDNLRDEEMVGLAMLLLVGGYHTTVSAIGTCTLLLLRDKDKADQLREDPELLPAALDELFRFGGPVHGTICRHAAQDLVIAGQEIAKGDTVVLSLAAANRDPGQFPGPDELDFRRGDRTNLAFGRGPHFCPGSDLAKLEIRVMLRILLQRYPDLAMAVPEDELFWENSYFILMLRALPIRLGQRAGAEPELAAR